MPEHPPEHPKRAATPPSAAYTLRKHSVLIDGHQTSVTLENAFWWRFCAIARSKNMSLNKLIGEIDHVRTGTIPGTRTGNLSSAIRVFVLEHGPTAD